MILTMQNKTQSLTHAEYAKKNFAAKSYNANFDYNGNLIKIETEDSEIISWAKSIGLS